MLHLSRARRRRRDRGGRAQPRRRLRPRQAAGLPALDDRRRRPWPDRLPGLEPGHRLSAMTPNRCTASRPSTSRSTSRWCRQPEVRPSPQARSATPPGSEARRRARRSLRGRPPCGRPAARTAPSPRRPPRARASASDPRGGWRSRARRARRCAAHPRSPAAGRPSPTSPRGAHPGGAHRLERCSSRCPRLPGAISSETQCLSGEFSAGVTTSTSVFASRRGASARRAARGRPPSRWRPRAPACARRVGWRSLLDRSLGRWCASSPRRRRPPRSRAGTPRVPPNG